MRMFRRPRPHGTSDTDCDESESNDSTHSGSAAGPYRVGVSSNSNTRYRKTMEDAHHFELNFLGREQAGYFAVFDGHAGSQTATFCAKELHNVLGSELGAHPSVPEALCSTFKAIDVKLEDQSIKNSGSTAGVVVVRDEGDQRRLYSANVGDTRVVLIRDGKALRMSYDHRGSDMHETKRIHNAGGILMNGRVNGVLAVTRSLGDLYMKDYVVGAPYTTETTLEDKDTRAIIACDGLWDVCSDQDAVDLIAEISDPQEASKLLIKHALDNFSTDNLTVMVVNLHETGTGH